MNGTASKPRVEDRLRRRSPPSDMAQLKGPSARLAAFFFYFREKTVGELPAQPVNPTWLKPLRGDGVGHINVRSLKTAGARGI